MKRILWFIGAALLTPALWFAIYRVEWELFPGNEETTTNVSSAPMLNGSLFLGLYRQNMWDAVLWTVIESSATPAKSLPAHNAATETAGRVVAGRSDLGFDHQPSTLLPTSDSTAQLCSGTSCQFIACSSTTRMCATERTSTGAGAVAK